MSTNQIVLSIGLIVWVAALLWYPPIFKVNFGWRRERP